MLLLVLSSTYGLSVLILQAHQVILKNMGLAVKQQQYLMKWVYLFIANLSPIIDLHNNEVISYSISLSFNFEQTREIVERAVRQAAERCKTYTTFRPRLAIPNERVATSTEKNIT